jgi:DNA-binding SARP family transcriptional activator/ABC-type branched-subunit amino acid transport system substrate-binding protein
VRVKVFLAGRVGLEAGGVALDEARFPGRQGRLLFAYLIAERGRPVPRGELAAALWGEELPRTWDKALSVLVSKLRGLLTELGLDGPGALTSAFGCYRLALPECWIDVVSAAEGVDNAETALARGEIDSAREAAHAAERLLRESFIPGENVDWVETKRREYADIRSRALNVLAEASLRLGSADEAMRWAEQAIAAEPFRETGYRLLMQAHGATGNRAEALRVYERCRSLLREELGANPSPETEAIFLGLLDKPVTRSPRTPKPDISAPAPSTAEPLRPRRIGAVLIVGSLVVATVVAVTLLWPGGDHAHSAPLRPIASVRCSAVHQGKDGAPQLLIAADLPLQPGVLETTTPMVNAMLLELERHDYTAGPYRVALQVCDDATPDNVGFDPATCSANAREYVKDPAVIAEAGPFSSGCAVSEIPILNRGPGGPLAIVSPSATYVGLTRPTLVRGSGEPKAYYPTGRRNYAHVVPTDDVQAAADVITAQRLGVTRVYLVDQGDPPSQMFVDYFTRAARRLGIAVVGRGSWDATKDSDGPLAAAIARTDANGVFLAIPGFPRTVRLLTDLRKRLGSAVQFMAPDAFDAQTALLAGRAAEGMTFSQPGPANDHLGSAGQEFVRSFLNEFGAEPSRFAIDAAQAIDVLLDAIARSDGTRRSVTSNLFDTSVSDGIFGSFLITPTGDTTLNAVAIYRIVGGKVTPFANVVVPDALVAPD